MSVLAGLHVVGWPLLAGATAMATKARGAIERLLAGRARFVLTACFVLLHLSAAAILCYVVVAFFRFGLTEWVERAVFATAKYWAGGGNFYPDDAVLKRIAVLPYGPLLFQSVGAVYKVSGGSAYVVKLLPIVLSCGVYGLMFVHLRRLGIKLWEAAFSVELFAVIVGIMGFMVKADIMLIFIAVYACLTIHFVRRELLAGVLLAILAGLATAIKLHGAFYVLPAAIEYLALWPRRWAAKFCAAAAIAGAVASAPFLVPRTSFFGYIHVLRLASRDGFLPGIFISNIAFIFTMVLCVHVLTEPDVRDAAYHRLMKAVLAAGFLVSIFAAKSEAGPHHLIPLLPYLCAPLARAASARRQGVQAFLFILFLVSFQPVSSVVGDILLMLANWHRHAAVI